jgi:hypothetical protein
VSITARRVSLRIAVLSMAVVLGGATLSMFRLDVAVAAGCANEAGRTGASAQLPDCRAYEQVSPQEKGGFPASGITSIYPAQVSPDGDQIAYGSPASYPGAEGNTAIEAAHLAERIPTGWKDFELSPALPDATELTQDFVGYDFSENLSESITTLPGIPLTPNAAPRAYNLYLRHMTGPYTLLNGLSPRTPVEELCPPSLGELCPYAFDVTTLAGVTPDFSHVLLESTSEFTPEAPEEVPTLYESVEGAVRLVGVLPDGKPADGSTAGSGSSIEYFSSAGFDNIEGRLENDISEDGSHVAFEAAADGGVPDPAQSGSTEVYDRIDGSETKELSAPEPGVEGPGSVSPAKFWAASTDGARVFFTSAAELTAASQTGPEKASEDLYEYDFDRPSAPLRDLSVDSNAVDASTGAQVLGVVGASRDGSYVYFVAGGELAPGNGVDGQPNLYVEHEGGSPAFIATLNGSYECNFRDGPVGALGLANSDACDWTEHSQERTAYVTPSGEHLAFTSTRSLLTTNFPSGYDNTDRVSGTPDGEVYEYSFAESGEGTLVCVSCDPTGAQPIGSALIGGVSPETFLSRETNGSVTDFSPGDTIYHTGSRASAFEQTRAVSDNGARLFFTAPGPVASPAYKVYEYEQDGEGTCEVARGCIESISNVTDAEQDVFLGSDSTGENVFLATRSRLVSADEDNIPDIYDARVLGQAPLPPAEGCRVDCRTPSVGASEGANVVSGSAGPPGNLVPDITTPIKTKMPKPLTRAEKLRRALAACRTKRARKQRAECERAAKKRYATPAVRKRTKTTTKDDSRRIK